MQYEIRITGSGEEKDIIEALKVIAENMEKGDHRRSLDVFNRCEWEDHILYTEIKEVEDES